MPLSPAPRWHAAPRTVLAAIAALTTSVTALAAAPPSVAAPSDYQLATTVLKDTFSRSVASGWGTATSGQAYATTNAGLASAASDKGVVKLTPGAAVTNTASAAKALDARASIEVSASAATTKGNGFFTTLALRSTSTSSYRAAVRFGTDGQLVIKLLRAEGASESVLKADTVVATGAKANTAYTFEFQVTGTNPVTLASRVYATGSTAPAWQMMYDDSASNRLTATGHLGVSSYLSGSSTAVNGSYDNLTLSTVTTTPAAPAPAPTTPANPAPAPTPTPSSSVGSVAVGSASYSVPAGAIYVAAKGDSSGSGTASSPYGSLATAFAKAANGATIVLRGGNYHESVELPFNRKLVVQNYPGEAVWLDGASKLTGWTQSGSTWSAPWNYKFARTVGLSPGADETSWWVNSKYPTAGYPEQVWVDGSALTQVGSASAVTAGTFFVDTGAKKLIIGTNPSGKTVEASTLQKALIVHGTGSTLRGFGIKRYATTTNQLGALSLEVNDLTVENVVVKDNATIGVFAWGSNLTMNRVTVTGSGVLGVALTNLNGATVSQSDISSNNVERFNEAPVAGGLKATTAKNVTISKSRFKGNVNSNGLWFDESSQQIKVSGNTFLDNGTDGLEVEISDSVKIVDNYFTNNGWAGVRLFNTSHAEVWNNTIAGNKKWSIRILQDERRGKAPVTMFSEAINFRNNVVAFANASCPVLVHDLTKKYTGAQLGINFNGTAYHRSSASAPADFACWANGSSGLLSIKSLASFQSTIGLDKQSKEFTGTAILDSAYQLTSAASSAAASVPLAVNDSTIAGMLGVSTGWKGVGAKSPRLG